MDKGEFVNEAINFANRIKKARFMRRLDLLFTSCDCKVLVSVMFAGRSARYTMGSFFMLSPTMYLYFLLKSFVNRKNIANHMLLYKPVSR